MIDGTADTMCAYIDEERFDIDSMRKKNRESIYLDGIENVADGVLYYTDELVDKVRKAFGVSLTKAVSFEKIEEVAQFLITEIIEKNK